MSRVTAISSSGAPYSANLDDYSPRCISCHKKFDMKAIRGE